MYKYFMYIQMESSIFPISSINEICNQAGGGPKRLLKLTLHDLNVKDCNTHALRKQKGTILRKKSKYQCLTM